MTFFKLLLVSFFLSSAAYAGCKQERVAIIDTGLFIDDPKYQALLCKDGHHWDFEYDKPVSFDSEGHGTAITNLVMQYAENANYCLLIYRWYSMYNRAFNEVAAFRQAVKDGATIVNFSGGGKNHLLDECEIIRDAPNTVFIVAAGNEGEDLATYRYYPASCGSDNVIPVGSLDVNGKRSWFSNFGDIVKTWEVGHHVKVKLPHGKTSYMSGTSISTAIHTGKTILQISRQCGTIH